MWKWELFDSKSWCLADVPALNLNLMKVKPSNFMGKVPFPWFRLKPWRGDCLLRASQFIKIERRWSERSLKETRSTCADSCRKPVNIKCKCKWESSRFGLCFIFKRKKNFFKAQPPTTSKSSWRKIPQKRGVNPLNNWYLS